MYSEDKDILKELVWEMSTIIEERVEAALRSKDAQMILCVLNAHNAYEETCGNGNNYIFDLNNQDDLSTCVKGGLTWTDIAKMEERDYYGKNLFLFGEIYPTPKQIEDEDELVSILCGNLGDIVDEVLIAPYSYPSYSEIYNLYVAYYLEN